MRVATDEIKEMLRRLDAPAAGRGGAA